MSSRFTQVVAVHLFLLKGKKVLLSRRFNTGYEDGKFSVPAGHVDQGESVLTAMVREAAEEVGIKISPKDLLLAHIMHRSTDRPSVDFFFSCRKWRGEPSINEPDKCDCLKWVSIEELPPNTIPYIKKALNHFSEKQTYSQLGW